MLQEVAGVICLFAYLLLIIGIVRMKIEQSFAAFLLWAMLDLISAVATILEDGNYWLALGNAIGTVAITILLIVKRQFSWSWIETLISVLVVICLIVWYVEGDKAGIVASSLAVVLASIPQMVETYKKPSVTPTGVYMVFLVANIVSFVAGESWSIEERFYQGCSIFLCVVIIVFAIRQTKVAET